MRAAQSKEPKTQYGYVFLAGTLAIIYLCRRQWISSGRDACRSTDKAQARGASSGNNKPPPRPVYRIFGKGRQAGMASRP